MRLLNRTRPSPDEADENSLVMKTEVTETDATSEVGIDCDTVHSEETVNVFAVSDLQNSYVELICEPLMEEWAPETVGHLEEDVRDSHQDSTEEPTESLDIKYSINLEASEESVGNSFEGESSSILSTQSISDENRDKGMPENDVRGEVEPEEESLSALLLNRIVCVNESEVSPSEAPLSEAPLSEAPLSEAPLSKRKEMFICDNCKKSFATKRKLGNHVRVHFDSKPFSCKVCKKTFKWDNNRYRHELTHLKVNTSSGNSEKENKKNQYNCGICPKTYTSKSGLQMHLYMHSERYKCICCGKCFHCNALLRRHFRTHTNEKPFKCVVCLKCFRGEANLKSHMLTHSSEKPFSCEICEKKFKSKNTRRQHALSHLRK